MKKAISLTLAMVLCLLLSTSVVAHGAEPASNIVPVVLSSAGERTAAITSDGTLWMWGDYTAPYRDAYGMETGFKTSPTKIMTDVASVSCSDYFAAAIKKDGSLWMWGINTYGQLGNGQKWGGYQMEPTKVMDNVVMVSCGYRHTAVIKTDGSLWLFGDNSYGQIGNDYGGNDVSLYDDAKEYPIQTVPIEVMHDVAFVNCGGSYTAAIKKDGSLWMWGRNQYGQIGNGEECRVPSMVNRSADVHVPQMIMEDVAVVDCGRAHTAAIKKDGSLWTWGLNMYGCLGVGSTSARMNDGYNSCVPVKVMEDMVAVSCNFDLTAAIKKDGSLWMCGRNENNRLICPDSSQDVGTLTKVMDDCRLVSIGSDGISAFVVKNDGGVYGWGSKLYIGMGVNKDESQTTPIKVLDNVTVPSNWAKKDIPSDIPLDIPSDWANGDINSAIVAELVPDDLQKGYRAPISRGDAAKILMCLLEESSGKNIAAIMDEKGVQLNEAAFTDTSDKAAFEANALGIINGVGEGRFDPGGKMTRAQIAAVINRIARLLGVETDGFSHGFTDVSGHWVDSELGWPSSVGIINGVGDNKFSPDATLTAEQLIVVALRALRVLLT